MTWGQVRPLTSPRVQLPGRMWPPSGQCSKRPQSSELRPSGGPPTTHPPPSMLHLAHRNGKAVSIGGSNSYRILFLILANPRLCTGNEPEAAGTAGSQAPHSLVPRRP